MTRAAGTIERDCGDRPAGALGAAIVFVSEGCEAERRSCWAKSPSAVVSYVV